MVSTIATTSSELKSTVSSMNIAISDPSCILRPVFVQNGTLAAFIEASWQQQLIPATTPQSKAVINNRRA